MSSASSAAAAGGAALRTPSKFQVKNLERSMQHFERDDHLYMQYNNDGTGYLMVLAAPDSCYGLTPFLFHFELGSDYPFQPPKCHYISVCQYRIHPNLYQQGKVCLSILGTWQGPGWTAAFTIYTL